MDKMQFSGRSPVLGLRAHPRLSGLTEEALAREIEHGARLIVFEYCISFVAITLRRPSEVYLIRRQESRVWRGLPYSVLSLIAGWWGLPWGFVHTPAVILSNCLGGHDVTARFAKL